MVIASEVQWTTDRYIPIGMSPGIPAKFSHIGVIIAVDSGAKNFSIRSDSASKTMAVPPSTQIWPDRSKTSKTNIDGKFDKLQTGLRIEVMHSLEDENIAIWIKIETPQGCNFLRHGNWFHAGSDPK